MRKILFFTTMVLVLGITIPAMAQVTIEVAPPPPPSVRVAVPLPPPIVFAAPPEVVVLPETEVYVVPSVPEEIFFYNGFWWRPWNGRWYRSLRYDAGWGIYAGVPAWYGGIYPGWRENYRLHLWGGHPWSYHHISHGDLNRNWRAWHNTGHWNRPEHREFTHHRDGRLYSGRQQDRGRVDKGRGEGHVSKGTTGAGQGHVTKGTTQGNLNKGATGTGQGHVTKGGTTQGTINKGGTATGQGQVGTGRHGATGANVHSSGQTTRGQHTNEAEGRRK